MRHLLAMIVFLVPGAYGQTTHTVELRDVRFEPADLGVRVGDTVHWVWVSGFHNVESGTIVGGAGVPDGRFRSGSPAGPPATFDLTFDQAFLAAHPSADGTYPYYCVVHTFSGMAGVVRVVGCLTDAECADTNPCTDDVCSAGACAHFPNAAACDDGDPCTGNDACQNGACAGVLVSGCCRSHADCNDGNPCTDDLCDATVCRASPRAGACDDGNPCTADDSCVQGLCRGTPLEVCCDTDGDCDDGNACTDDQCASRECVHTNADGPCDDGDPCTEGDACHEGNCSGSALADCCLSTADCETQPCTETSCEQGSCIRVPIEGCVACDFAADCDDDNPCTGDGCRTGICVHSFNAVACDDGDSCTEEDACANGICRGVLVEGCCSSDEDCDDHDECTADACAGEMCVHDPVPDCEEPADDHMADDDDDAESPPDSEPTAPRARPRMCGAFGLIGWSLMLLLLASLRARRR